MYSLKWKQMLAGMIVLAASFAGLATAEQNGHGWQQGTLLETEKQQVPQGSMTTTTSQGKATYKQDKTKYDHNTTSVTNDNYDTFQVFTIRSGAKTYVARERLLFPWSKPASVNVGEEVTFSVKKGTMYLLGDDGKQHKASVAKVSVSSPE